jgi:hypothetical protein
MPLYRWYSTYLANYGNGQIIVMAPDVATARKLAEAEFAAYDREYSGHNYDQWADEDDSVSIARRLMQFHLDVAAEPEAMGNVVLVRGSE